MKVRKLLNATCKWTRTNESQLKKIAVVKCKVRNIKICELMGFVEIIREIKTKNISLLKSTWWCELAARYYHSYALNDSIKVLLKMAWFLKFGLKRIFVFKSSEHNRGKMSSLIGDKMLDFSMEAFFILFFLNSTNILVMSKIKLLWRHHLSTLITSIQKLKKVLTWRFMSYK